MTGYARERFAGAVRVALSAASALLLVTASPAAALEQKLTAADGAASDTLGTSVSIDGRAERSPVLRSPVPHEATRPRHLSADSNADQQHPSDRPAARREPHGRGPLRSANGPPP